MTNIDVFAALMDYLDEHNPMFAQDEPVFATEEDDAAEFEELWDFMLEDDDEN